MNNKFLNNINIILGSKLYKELELYDLESVYNKYSAGIDCLALHTYNFFKKYSKHKLPEVFPKDPKIINNNMMYRGATDREAFMLMSPKIRVSKDTSNVYTLLMSEILPSWKPYPRRNRSVIFTDNKFNASSYASYRDSTVYNVIPPNNATIVISESPDVWNAFNELNKFDNQGLETFNKVISIIMGIFYYFLQNKYTDYEIIDILNLKDKYQENYKKISSNGKIFKNIDILFKNRNLNEIYNIFNYMDNFKKKHKNYLPNLINFSENYIEKDGIIKIFKYIINKYINSTTFIKTLDDILNPKNNLFRTMKYKQYNNSDQNSREIWTESPCLLIEDSYYEDIDFLETYFQIIGI